MKHTIYLITLISSLLIVSGSALAEQTSEPGVQKVKELSCKDVMRFSGETRSIAVGFIHGYLLGKKGAKEYNRSELSGATDEFIEYCLDNPNASAVEAMAKFTK